MLTRLSSILCEEHSGLCNVHKYLYSTAPYEGEAECARLTPTGTVPERRAGVTHSTSVAIAASAHHSPARPAAPRPCHPAPPPSQEGR